MPIRHRKPLCGVSNPDWFSTPGPTGINDPADINHTIKLRRSRGMRGAIQMAEEGEMVLARAGKAAASRRPRKAGSRIYDEVNIVGSYPLKGKPWKNDTEILADMPLDNWFPADNELSIFANSKIPKKNSVFMKAPDVWSFLNVLYSYPAKRYNLFTHGTALSGNVIKGDVLFTPGKQYDLLGTWYYTAINPGFLFLGRGEDRTITDLHNIMPHGAQLIIYGCKSGSSVSDLKRLAKLLGIFVKGFSQSILYHPVLSRDGKRIVGWKYSHGKTGKIVDDYHALTPDRPPK